METTEVSEFQQGTETPADEGPPAAPTAFEGAPPSSPDAQVEPVGAETRDMLEEGDSSSSCWSGAAGSAEGEASLPSCGETDATDAVSAVSPDLINQPAAEEGADACTAEPAPAESDAAAAQEGEKTTDPATPRIPRLQGRQAWRPRGQRRSFGRLCKGKAAAGGCADDGGPSSAAAGKRKWQQEQQQKQQQRQARDLERQARAAKEAIRVQRRKQREAKRQRKKENELKSAKVQVIKDTTKIRKWNKQARRQLVKMSPEMIKQLYGVQL
ncbi:hypothetical protein Emed_002182 [Eimeria media]